MAKVKVQISKNFSNGEVYEEVEYIQGTGTQWIELGSETDYNLTQLYIDYQWTEYLSGCIYCSGIYPPICDYISFSGGAWIFSYAYSTGSPVYDKYYELSDGSSVLARHLITRTYDGVKLDNSLIFARDNNTYIPHGEKTKKITIFNYVGVNSGNDLTGATAYMKLYRFKYGSIDKFKADLVPCVRQSDQVAGLYDTINKQFYTNAGTGTFVIGSKTGTTYTNEDLNYNIDKHNGLKSIESLSQSTGKPKEIFYGVVPGDGEISIIDVDGKFAQMIKNNEISNSNMPVDIYVNNKLIQSHKTSNSSYSIEDKSLSLSLSNKLSDWDMIHHGGFGLIPQTKNLYQLLESALMSAGYTTTEISEMVGDCINDLWKFVPYPYLKATTLRDVIDKICTLAQLVVYENDEGQIRFHTARPILQNNQNVIEIPKHCQFAPLSGDLIVQNKYETVNVETFSGAVEVINDTTVNNYETLPYSDIDPKNWSYGTPTIQQIQEQYGNYVARVEAGYHTGSFSFEIGHSINKENSYIKLVNALKNLNTFQINMTNVPEMYEENDYISIQTDQILYSYSGSDVSSDANNEFALIANNNTTYYNTLIPFSYTKETNSFTNFGGQIKAEYVVSTIPSITVTATLPDESYINLTIDNTFTVNCTYKILTRKSEITAAAATELGLSVIQRDIKEYAASKIIFNILGTKITVDLTSNNETNQSTDNNTFNLQTNELCQTSEIANSIKNNILSDYANGIAVYTTSVACNNYYNTDGTLAKNWANGEVLEVGEAITMFDQIDSEGKLPVYKITGRNFKYSGVPLIDLELQELNTKLEMFNYTAYDANGYAETSANYDGTPASYGIGTSTTDSALTSAVKSKNTIINIPKTHNGLPVTRILGRAFDGDYGTINIPSNIVEIVPTSTPNRLFEVINYNGRVPAQNSSSLSSYFRLYGKKINISNEVEILGDALFYNTTYYYTTIYDVTVNFEPNSKCKIIGRCCFRNLKITSINLPNSLTTLYQHAFYDCNFSALDNFIIPGSVTLIDNGAFYDFNGPKITFNHSASASITLGTDLFDSKTAREIDVYTDNATIKNYNWAGDNVTATFYHLDGTPWES